MNGVILIKMEAFVEDDERKKVIEQFKVDIQNGIAFVPYGLNVVVIDTSGKAVKL